VVVGAHRAAQALQHHSTAMLSRDFVGVVSRILPLLLGEFMASRCAVFCFTGEPFFSAVAPIASIVGALLGRIAGDALAFFGGQASSAPRLATECPTGVRTELIERFDFTAASAAFGGFHDAL